MHGQPRVCIFVDSALPAHAVRCSVRVSCSTNFLLHEGMLVVCVRVRRFLTIAPPTKTKKLVGKEATELSTDKYGAAEWWLLVEPM